MMIVPSIATQTRPRNQQLAPGRPAPITFCVFSRNRPAKGRRLCSATQTVPPYCAAMSRLAANRLSLTADRASAAAPCAQSRSPHA